jgi:two-component system response regulator (stage 0 sporulation protein F)
MIIQSASIGITKPYPAVGHPVQTVITFMARFLTNFPSAVGIWSAAPAMNPTTSFPATGGCSGKGLVNRQFAFTAMESRKEMEPTNKVLVADDELLIRWSLAEALSQEGYEVKAVEDGNKALDAIRSENFDFVITDLMMPGMNGWEVLEWTKKLYPKAKVVIITAYGTEDVEAMAKEKGACGYVEKPEIIDKIKALLKSFCSNRSSYGTPN